MVAESPFGRVTILLRFGVWSAYISECLLFSALVFCGTGFSRDCFFLVAIFGIGGAFGAGGTVSGNGIVALSILFPFVSVLVWFFIKASLLSGVDVIDGRVKVRNFSEVLDIPVGEVSSVQWSGGVSLVLNDGAIVRLIAFPSSWFSFLCGYGNFKRVAHSLEFEVKKGQDHRVSQSSPRKRCRDWSPYLLLGVFVSFLVLFSCAYFIFAY